MNNQVGCGSFVSRNSYFDLNFFLFDHLFVIWAERSKIFKGPFINTNFCKKFCRKTARNRRETQWNDSKKKLGTKLAEFNVWTRDFFQQFKMKKWIFIRIIYEGSFEKSLLILILIFPILNDEKRKRTKHSKK